MPGSSYTVKNSSINEAGTYGHQSIAPGSSVNEPPLNPAAVPVITSLVPNTGIAGSSNFVMTVNGTGFGDWSVLTVGGVDRDPTFVSNKVLTTVIRGSNWPKGTVPVTVRNGSFPSNVLNITFT